MSMGDSDEASTADQDYSSEQQSDKIFLIYDKVSHNA